MTTQTDSLTRAIDYLDAVEVAPGRYAYRDDNTARYYVCGERDLRSLGEYLSGTYDDEIGSRNDGDRYSHWCNGSTSSTEMPAWWTPNRRSAMRRDIPHRWLKSLTAPCPRCEESAGRVEHDGNDEYADALGVCMRCSYRDADWGRTGVEADGRIYITADLDTGEEVTVRHARS